MLCASVTGVSLGVSSCPAASASPSTAVVPETPSLDSVLAIGRMETLLSPVLRLGSVSSSLVDLQLLQDCVVLFLVGLA